MKKAVFTIVGISPLRMSKYIQDQRPKDKPFDEWERESWPKRAHVRNGQVFIPATAIKNTISAAAKYANESIKGCGKQTYTKKFEAGVMVVDDMFIGVSESDITGEWLHVSADGRRGGSTRVMKCYPTFNEWRGQATVYILDDIITEDVFERYMKIAGNFIGLMAFRPANNNPCGRFTIEGLTFYKEKLM